jgi:NAD(P)-dependent dehydrogenase (short-subunit alcohol dehydrogenase family)
MRSAVVTGGGRGIGRVIARELTRAGWAVVVTGRTPAPLDDAVAAGDASRAVVGDAADVEAVRAAVAAAQELGDLELVVANAGVLRSSGALWESDPELWWSDAEINLRGPMLALHVALNAMLLRRTGRVVVVASGFATEPVPGASSYAASKAGVLRLVDSVAAELVGTGLAVFAISPGLVATGMTEFPEEFLAFHPEMRGKALRDGRAPEECARLVLDLASGRYDAMAGRFVHVRDDLDASLVALRTAPELGTLRIAAH